MDNLESHKNFTFELEAGQPQAYFANQQSQIFKITSLTKNRMRSDEIHAVLEAKMPIRIGFCSFFGVCVCGVPTVEESIFFLGGVMWVIDSFRVPPVAGLIRKG